MPHNILLIDDSSSDRDLIHHALEKEHGNFILTDVSSRKDLNKCLKKGGYDVVLTNIDTLGFQRLQILDTIHTSNPGIPVIVITGKGSEEIAAEAIHRGASEYLTTQPKHLRKLPSAIRRISKQQKKRNDSDRIIEELKNTIFFDQMIFNTSPVGILIFKESGQCIMANPAGSAVSGGTVGQLLRMNFRKLESYKRWGLPEAAEEALRSGISVRKEVRVVNTSGKDVWYEALLSPFHLGEEKHLLFMMYEIKEQKHAEEDLRKSEKRFIDILENIQDGYFRTDKEGRLIMVNPSGARMFGYDSANEMIGLVASTLYNNPENRPGVLDEMQRKGRIYDRVSEGRSRDGTTFWVSVNAQLYYSASEEVLGIETIVRDITERKRSEEQIHQSEKEYKYLFQNAHDAILLLDPVNEIVLEANDRAFELYGFSKSEFIGLSIRNISKFPEKGDQKIAEVLRDGHLGNFETVQFRKDGSEIILEVSASIVEHNGKRVILSVNHDITNRKHAEVVRDNERALLKTLIDNLPSSVFIKDREYRKIVVNPEHLQRVSTTLRSPRPLSETDMLGKTDFEVYPKELAEEYFAEDQRIIQNGETVLNREHFSLTPDGQLYWELISKIPLRDKSGSIIGLVGIANNITERKRAEEELKISETRYRLISNVVSDYVFSTKVETDGTLVHEWTAGAFESMTGYTFDEYIAIGGWRAIVHPEDRAIDDRDMEKLKKNQQVVTELRTIMKSGKIMWARIYAHPVWDEERNALAGIYGAVQNISAHKKAEESLRESEERFRSLYENSTVGIYRTTPEGKILLANPALVRMLGYSTFEELASRDLEKEGFEHSYDRKRFLRNIEKGGEVRGLESCWIKQDGSKIYIRENSHAIRDSRGKTLYFDGMVEDITEQKHTEESLLRLKQAVAASSEVIFMTDRNGIFTFANAAFTQLYGYEPHEVIGTATPRILKSGMQQSDQYTAFWHTLLNRQIVKDEWINRTKDGRLVNTEITANPILDSQGTIVGFLAIQRNVTEQRILEKEIHQAQKLESLGTLASGIAHDFNNILGIIMGHSSMISISHDNPQRLKASIEAIDKASERGASLVRQMLTFARKSDVEFTPIQVNDSIKEIEKLYSEIFPKTITLVCETAENLPYITADSTQIHQVLLNLCVNARDAIEGTGTITISTGTASGKSLHQRFVNASFERYVFIEVSDTGVGMDEDTLRRIFDPFFTTKGIGKGTGLGLAVVFGIMESHGGFIDVRSTVGHGTTFSLYFPVKKTFSKSEGQEKEIQSEIRGGTETILVVEDEDLLRELIQISLEGNGYTVLTAVNGEEAVEIYRQHQQRIALVLSDLGLPIYSGRDVLRKLMTFNPTVKCIIATGYTDPGEKSELFKDGAKEIVQKPYNMSVLLKKIRDVLDA